MDVNDMTDTIRRSPSVLLNRLRDRLEESFTLPFSDVDEDVVTNLTGIYQQALKDNGFGNGIKAEGTVQVLGYKQDISVAWQPGILLSPDLVQWLQAQSDDVRNRINSLIALAVVFYRETLNQVRELIRERLDSLRDRLVPDAFDDAVDRLGSVRTRFEAIREEPVNEILALIRDVTGRN